MSPSMESWSFWVTWGICVRQTWSVRRAETVELSQGALLCKTGMEEIVTVQVLHTFIVTFTSCFQCWIRFYPFLTQLAGVVRFNEICLTINRAVNRHGQPIWSEVCDSEASWKLLRWPWHSCMLGLDWKHSWEAGNAARRKSGIIYVYCFTIQFVVRKYKKYIFQSFFAWTSKQASLTFQYGFSQFAAAPDSPEMHPDVELNSLTCALQFMQNIALLFIPLLMLKCPHVWSNCGYCRIPTGRLAAAKSTRASHISSPVVFKGTLKSFARFTQAASQTRQLELLQRAIIQIKK